MTKTPGIRDTIKWFIDLPTMLIDRLTVTQHDLAEQEIEGAKAQLQRLEDLAAHHSSLAAVYRQGAQAIRQGHAYMPQSEAKQA